VRGDFHLSLCPFQGMAFYMKIHRHTGAGRYPVFFTLIPDRVWNELRHFHASLCQILAWRLELNM